MPDNRPPPIIWIVTEGLTGTENQCLGVAESIGIIPVVKRITLRQPWKLLSPYLRCESRFTFQESLDPPSPDMWPDILIASGRKSIAVSRYIRRQSKGKTFTVQIQDPRINPKEFDLVVVPQHDPTRGDNVIVTVATPNRITPQGLVEARNHFAPLFQNLSCPRIAVLIGGTTKRHEFTREEAISLSCSLRPFENLMITTSRRTGTENTKLLHTALTTGQNYVWNGKSENPYMGMLAYADFILVTADSTSMISEAATTGKPVYVIPMPGLTHRQAQLIENLKNYGAVREFKGVFDHWDYSPLDDSQHVARIIRERCGLFS